MSSHFAPPPVASGGHHRLYRTIWRWHFYAGLIVAPFLLILSVTGAIYLFRGELNDWLRPDLYRVAPVATPLLPSRLIAAAIDAEPGTPFRIDMPAAADRPAAVHVRTAGGEREVMVDPGTARVLGSVDQARTLVGAARLIHGSLMAGWWGSAALELASCWALVLIATGVWLWWPRGRTSLAGVMWPRLHARGRVFWRDLHAVTGVWTVALIAFLLVTGLPWALVQGPLVRSTMAALGIGNRADAANHHAPASRPAENRIGQVAWSQQDLPLPSSNRHAGHGSGSGNGAFDAAAIAGADAIPPRAARAGVVNGYRLVLPDSPTGVYSVLAYPDRPEGQRLLHFDRWSGQLLSDNGWQHYGVGAKAIELGVQIHMGRYFGRANQLLMLVPCIGIVVLVISGTIMWWRRRPQGRRGAPPPITGAQSAPLMVLLTTAGILMPLFGASLLALASVDCLVRIGRRSGSPASS
jgi:uncharacterized iron-regulated membrane protein